VNKAIIRCLLVLMGTLMLLGGCNWMGGKEASAPQNPPFKVPFESNDWSDVPWPAKGGIWYFTKEKHPGNLDTLVEWDNDDVLLIQLSDKKYYGYSLDPISVEIVGPETVKITLDLNHNNSSFSDDQSRRCTRSVEVQKVSHRFRRREETEHQVNAVNAFGLYGE
jgi:hypothetical protein